MYRIKGGASCEKRTRNTTEKSVKKNSKSLKKKEPVGTTILLNAGLGFPIQQSLGIEKRMA